MRATGLDQARRDSTRQIRGASTAADSISIHGEGVQQNSRSEKWQGAGKVVRRLVELALEDVEIAQVRMLRRQEGAKKW